MTPLELCVCPDCRMVYFQPEYRYCDPCRRRLNAKHDSPEVLLIPLQAVDGKGKPITIRRVGA